MVTRERKRKWREKEEEPVRVGRLEYGSYIFNKVYT